MCWSGPISIAATAIGGAGTIYAKKKGVSRARWLTLLFFSLMELLQAVSYVWIGQCDVSANVWLTRLSYIHICFQIPMANYFALSFISEQRRKKWFRKVMAISLTASGLMLVSMLVPMIWQVPTAWLCEKFYNFGLCSNETCAFAGNWHLAWRVSLLKIDPFYLLYFIPVFGLPILYGSWRFTLYHLMAGPFLAALATSNTNEQPAVWCLFAIGLLLATLWPPLRNWLETPKRKSA